MPPGTAIYNENKSVLIADLVKQDQSIILAKGGKGGLGNSHFKSATNQAPRQSTDGEDVEEKWIWLSLKLFADVGIIGKPNAGKSTLLSKLSKAQPKIADYPFTTLHPILGVASQFDKEIILADIPGLIEGAHEGKGLGDKFLAHIERCKILLHILDSSDPEWSQNYHTIKNELKKYGHELIEKKEIIALNKSDLSSDYIHVIQKELKKITGEIPLVISSFSGQGLKELMQILFDKCDQNND